MWLIFNYCLFIVKFFWILLQEFFLLKLIVFSRIQKTTLTNLELLILITSLNQDLVVVSPPSISKLIYFYSNLIKLIIFSIRKIRKYGKFLLIFVRKLFNRNDLWARVILINLIKYLELSFNSYIGILLIIIGLIVKIDFKFSIQKDL